MSEPRFLRDRERPVFPARAVITGGMPYGNKDLHFGHVGGVFVHADTFARFLRDRIGAANVIFVSGTDCYGSPIVEYHREALERGELEGTLEEFVAANHERQKQTLAAYHVAPDLYAASSIGRAREVHQQWGEMLMATLREHGHVEQRSTLQFYDVTADSFLNGRQVHGRCPVQNCPSEKAYADECSMGHQYDPKQLIDPVSTLSGETPEMREVTNWYLRLDALRELLQQVVSGIRDAGEWRRFVVSSMLEYFEPPVIHVTKQQLDGLAEIAEQLPPHESREGRAKSLQLVFEDLPSRERAGEMLAEHGVRFRTGKTLVPFRLTGDLEWGLPAPTLDGLDGQTFWVWPESLWAPISFCATYLEAQGGDVEDWREWWCSKDAACYQFIGEDNVFFYSLPQMAIFLGLQGPRPVADAPEGQLQQTTLIANRHLQFLGRKASSSGKVKPPMAMDLLAYYTPEQLRAHFLGLSLGQRSVGFRPKPLDPSADEKAGDPVLKEGNLLSNTFNRAARGCFYTAQKYTGGAVPEGQPADEVVEECEAAILDFEAAMFRHEFHEALRVAGALLRSINQRWSRAKPMRDDCEDAVRRQALLDALHAVRVATVLMHPVAPVGTEMIREHLQLGPELWDWARIFEPLCSMLPAGHGLKELPPRVDFFAKHESQF